MFLWDLRPGVKQSYAIKQEILIWHHQASSYQILSRLFNNVVFWSFWWSQNVYIYRLLWKPKGKKTPKTPAKPPRTGESGSKSGKSSAKSSEKLDEPIPTPEMIDEKWDICCWSGRAVFCVFLGKRFFEVRLFNMGKKTCSPSQHMLTVAVHFSCVLRRGPRCYFRCECFTGGESVAGPRVNRFLALSH